MKIVTDLMPSDSSSQSNKGWVVNPAGAAQGPSANQTLIIKFRIYLTEIRSGLIQS